MEGSRGGGGIGGVDRNISAFDGRGVAAASSEVGSAIDLWRWPQDSCSVSEDKIRGPAAQ